ncbi:MAG TPA: type II toxin-antitoxin system VapC family toxin [Actinomycetota bacterium]|nr:type II toxin-antitoxin system VapC family toxin [Actinomycetota bacterium]
MIDASVALPASASQGGFDLFRDELVAPALLWFEFRSVLHEAVWRRDVSEEQALRSLEAFAGSGVRERQHRRLGETAWRIASELGFAKTYDAEYLALAELAGCRLVTLDRRLRRGADRLGYVVSPDEI